MSEIDITLIVYTERPRLKMIRSYISSVKVVVGYPIFRNQFTFVVFVSHVENIVFSQMAIKVKSRNSSSAKSAI